MKNNTFLLYSHLIRCTSSLPRIFTNRVWWNGRLREEYIIAIFQSKIYAACFSNVRFWWPNHSSVFDGIYCNYQICFSINWWNTASFLQGYQTDCLLLTMPFPCLSLSNLASPSAELIPPLVLLVLHYGRVYTSHKTTGSIRWTAKRVDAIRGVSTVECNTVIRPLEPCLQVGRLQPKRSSSVSSVLFSRGQSFYSDSIIHFITYLSH